MIEKAIQSLLLNDSSVVSATLALDDQVDKAYAILQPIIDTRVYAVQLPKNCAQLMANGMPPSIFYYRGDTDSPKTHDGPVDLTKAILRLHCVASNPEIVRHVLWAVSNLFDGWSGVAGTGDAPAPITVQRMWVVNNSDAFDNPLGAAEFGLAESMIEITGWYNNP